MWQCLRLRSVSFLCVRPQWGEKGWKMDCGVCVVLMRVCVGGGGGGGGACPQAAAERGFSVRWWPSFLFLSARLTPQRQAIPCIWPEVVELFVQRGDLFHVLVVQSPAANGQVFSKFVFLEGKTVAHRRHAEHAT